MSPRPTTNMRPAPTPRLLLRSHPAWPLPGYIAVTSPRGAYGFVHAGGYPVKGLAPTAQFAAAVTRTLGSPLEMPTPARLRGAVEAGHAALVALRLGADFRQEDSEGLWGYGGSLALVLADEQGLHWAAIGQVSVYGIEQGELTCLKTPDTYAGKFKAHGLSATDEMHSIVTSYLGGDDAQAQASYGLARSGTLCCASEDLDTPVLLQRLQTSAAWGSLIGPEQVGAVMFVNP